MLNPVLYPRLKTFSVCLLLSAATMFTAPAVAADVNTHLDSVTWQMSYTGEAAEVVDGGLDKRGAYAGQIMLGADVDLDKALGWTGATLHVYATNRHGENLSEKGIGNSTSVQEIYGGQNTRLAQVSLVQKLLDDRLVLEIGHAPANISFLGSDLCQYFQINSACGNPTFVFKTSNFTWWPTSSWEAQATAWLTKEIYFHAGVYEVNPKRTVDSDHGTDWSMDGATGVIAPFNFGYKTTFETDTLPRKYEIGGWYDSSTYTDPLRDENGNAAAQTGLPYATHNGRVGLFARFEQMIWRPDTTSHRGLTLFGALMGKGYGHLVENDYQMIGLSYKGPLESRPNDNVAFVFTRQGYSSTEIQNLFLTRQAAGGTGSPHWDQMMMELSYSYYLTPQIKLQPNIQYIIHPDQMDDTTRAKNLPNTFLVGFRFDVNLADALHLNG